jgi:hypothetical protein
LFVIVLFDDGDSPFSEVHDFCEEQALAGGESDLIGPGSLAHVGDMADIG